MRTSLAAVLIFLVHTAACDKKPDGAASPPAAGDTGSAKPATPPPAADTGSAKPATPPPTADTGSAKPAATPPPAPDAAAPAAADAATLCPKILDKIRDCQHDASFATALEAGASGKDKKQIAKLIKGISEWPLNTCTSTPTFEVNGFLGHWDQLAAPAILETCASLGAAVKAAGGLFGGDMAM